MNTDRKEVKIGFVPLVDCALPVIAHEKGFAAGQGIELLLSKEVSWANIRDKVYLGFLDGAQMLAGMPMAANLRLMPNSCDIVAPFVLGRNGNAITVSHDLYGAMDACAPSFLTGRDLKQTGAVLKQVIEDRKKAGQPALRFGMVFPFSCHNYHLRYWMAACGIDPDQDVRLEVVPPPFMDRFLAEGRIDGFCVGEPWNSLAVSQDIGVIVASTSEIWPQCPEKMLGVKKDWADANPEALAGLLRALNKASEWVQSADNMDELAQILSSHLYLDVPASIISRALNGELRLKKGQGTVKLDNFLTLGGHSVNRPNQAEGDWIFSQMERWGQNRNRHLSAEVAKLSFNSDLYAHSLDKVNVTYDQSTLKLFDSV